MKGLEISYEEAMTWASHFYLTEELPKGFWGESKHQPAWSSEKILTHIRRNSNKYYSGWRSELLLERIQRLAKSVSRDCSWRTEEKR